MLIKRGDASVRPLCSLCLCGGSLLIVNHKGTENAEDAQRIPNDGRYTAMKTILVIVLSLLIPAGSLTAQTKSTAVIPDTAAGIQLKAWLRVFASGDDALFMRFINEHYSKTLLAENDAAYRADRAARTYLDTRGFDIRDIEKPSDEEIVVLAQSSLTGLWFRLTMKVEPAIPHFIAEYTSQRIQPPAKFPVKKLTEKELVREIKTFMDHLAAADAFSGTLLVAKDGKPIFKTVHGLASKAWNIGWTQSSASPQLAKCSPPSPSRS
jgi:hypothetical protein